MLQSGGRPVVMRFGVFDIDLETGELRKAGVRVKLQQQPFQVLSILLEHPGKIVSREELRQKLWPADTFVDFDLGLNSALRKVRSALGEAAENPTFIETIPRRGYRFIAPVTIERLAAPGLSGAGPPEVPFAGEAPKVLPKAVPSRLRAGVILISLGVAATVTLASLVLWRSSRAANRPPAAGIQSLAVLPLENLSGDPSQDYFADGMTDELITSLGQVSSLRVVSRTSVMQYRGVHKPLPQIARELNVDGIVEGTVTLASGRVRITAQLIQAGADRHLWAQSYESDIRNVLRLQDEIAQSIARQVGVTLRPGAQIRAGIDAPLNPEAYEAYLRGEYFLNRFTAESITKAAEYFAQAIEKDRNYVPAYSKLAGSNLILGNMGVQPKKVSYEKAQPLIARALEIDPQFGAAHAVKGWALMEYQLDFAAAGPEFKRAVELNPNIPEGHEGLADYYAATGQLEQAVLEMQRARQLDPLALIVNDDLCRILYLARRYDEALAQCKANVDLDGNANRGLWAIADVYAAKGMEAEAVSTFLQALRHAKVPPALLAAAESGAKSSGVKGYWQAVVPFMHRYVQSGQLCAYDLATAYAYGGNVDKALVWLQKGVDERCFGVTYVAVDPIFDGLRSDRRFVSQLNQMGLAQPRQVP